MASSGVREKEKFHDGNLKPYQHEELGQPSGVRSYEEEILLVSSVFLISSSFLILTFSI